jgi:hypothetical protein
LWLESQEQHIEAGGTYAGRIAQGGKIACGCVDCEGDIVSLLEFEEHAGAWERYQTESIYLTRHDLTLKVTSISLSSSRPLHVLRSLSFVDASWMLGMTGTSC